MTIKMSNALARLVPIIEVTYLRDFLDCIRSQQVLPDEKNYIPQLVKFAINIVSKNWPLGCEFLVNFGLFLCQKGWDL